MLRGTKAFDRFVYPETKLYNSQLSQSVKFRVSFRFTRNPKKFYVVSNLKYSCFALASDVRA